MSSDRVTSHRLTARVLLVGLIVCAVARPGAQQPSASDERIAVDAGVSVVSQYMFRGVRQNATGIAVWPFGDVRVQAHSGVGPLQRVVVGVGYWNSLNTGDTGSGGPAGNAWYESRLYGTVALQFKAGVSVGTSYTTYASPNDLFTTAKELAVRIGLDERARLGPVAINPHALVATELGAEPGVGQLDGGREAGTYFEVGAAPLYRLPFVRLAVPVKVGLSLHDYYELAGTDHTFGFASVGAEVMVPIGPRSRIGRWHVHGGVEIQRLGETPRAFNGGDRAIALASVGVRLER